MAPLQNKGKKRAAEDVTSSSKKVKSSSKPAASSSSGVAAAPPVYKSSLVADEVDFPRGGGSTLTPYEFKEATNEARQEADRDAKVEDSAAAVKKSKSNGKEASGKKSKGKAAASMASHDADTFRVEHLNYKRLSIGTPLLGRIHSIHSLHLIVSLPNQLFAHVPITSISAALTSRLSSLSGSTGSTDGEEEEEEDVPSLDSLFKVGQYVRARVSAVYGVGQSNPPALEGWRPRNDTEWSCRRVELTLQPTIVNEEVAKLDLDEGFCLTAAVQSVEDHGYLLDIGIPTFQGFLPFKDSKEFTPNSISKDGRNLEVGQLVDVCVTNLAENKRTCTFTISRDKVTKSSLSNVSSINSLLPGALVQALITAVVPSSGLNLKLLGFFDGSVDLFHLPTGVDMSTYSVGKKVKARITYLTTSAADQTQRFGLSLLPHVVALGDQQAPEGAESMEEFAENGTIFEKVTVLRVEPEWGLVVDVDDGVQGYVHISHVSDEHVSTLSASQGLFKVGSTHRARVIGVSSLDGLIQLSFKTSVLDRKFMNVSEVKIGAIMKGTIKKLTSNGLFINLQGSTDGAVFPLHYADIRLKNPERRFKIGSTVKCRVLNTVLESNRVSLTLKKTLVDSDLPIVASFDDAQIDTVTDGVVSRFLDKGLLVDMYGGVRAFVPVGEASDVFVQNLEDFFFVGKPVKIKIINRDESTSRLVASIRQAIPGSTSKAALATISTSDIEIGTLVQGTISAIHTAHVLLSLVPSQAKALLSKANLANHRGVSVDELASSLKVGEKLSGLIVLAKDDARSILIVANNIKTEKRQPSGISQQALSFDSIHIGEILPGRVVSHSNHGALIQISKTIRGRVHLTDSSDDYAQNAAFPEKDKILRAFVVKVDPSSRIIDLSLRPSRLNPEKETKIVDPEISSLEQLTVGQTVRGFVRGINDSGLFVALGRTVTARVMIKNLFDEFVKDWKPRFQINQMVEGKIVSLDLEQEKIDLSLRTKAAPEPRQKRATHRDFAVDQKVDAVVKAVAAFGLFLRIEDTDISGLCHKSEISDDANSDVGKALKGFREGDKVKAVIKSIDATPKAEKISFGIKPSYFADSDFDGSDGGEEDNEGGDEDEDESDVEMIDDNEGDVLVLGGEDSESDSIIMLGADEDDEPTASASTLTEARASSSASALELSGGFSWSAKDTDDQIDEDSDSDNDELRVASEQSKKKKKGIQQDLTADLQTKAPESSSDFERLLIGSPDSSFLWIQYMSFQLQISELDKARDIGRRALKTISYREEGEKLNVWVALLNLENAFGTEETADKMFKEAVQFNDPQVVHLKFAGILEQSEKFEKSEEVFKRALKKFGQSSEVWTAFAEYYFNRAEPESARELLPRSLKSLPKDEHIKTISKFAQLEFKLGDAERGKTIFEGIVDSYPKRLDLWSIYIDFEAKQGDIQAVRNLFERVLARKQSQKKAKFLFKKWMGIEKRLALPGDESGAEMVTAKARAFVQKAASGQDTAQEDEEME